MGQRQRLQFHPSDKNKDGMKVKILSANHFQIPDEETADQPLRPVMPKSRLFAEIAAHNPFCFTYPENILLKKIYES